MEKEKLLNVFFDNIEGFNNLGSTFIKRGDIEKAIEIFKKKIDYIRYSYEFEIISLERALQMMEDTKHLINILS